MTCTQLNLCILSLCFKKLVTWSEKCEKQSTGLEVRETLRVGNDKDKSIGV